MNEKLVPKLQFEFSSEWENKKLKDIIQISKEKYNPELDKTNYKCIELEHLSQGSGLLLGYTDSVNQNSIKNRFHNENILFGKLRPYLEKYYFPNFEGVCSSEIWVFDTKEYPKYIYYLIQTKRFLDIANVSSGSKMPRSDWNFMKDFNFPIPNIKTQKETSNFFSAIDKKIELLEKKHHQYNDFKKYLMQQIFAQKLRFENYSEWEIVKLKSILSERKEYTSDMNIYPHVTLSKEGIFPKTERYNRDFLVKDENKKYKVTHEGDICYNPANLKFGVITLNKFGSAIFSPIYVTFEVHNANNSYLSYYLTRNDFINRVRRYEEGTVYERMAVKPSDFLNEEIKLPSLKEQEHISKCLENIDKKIESIGYDIDKIKLFKKGLLQQMFV